ncbi:hypothetical protein TVAG_306510 [Trichomonas vaginalis G3]|uniref:Uncharacterized protein n=1 Tax=Trichomonas vaginalis (strain ATCC PRA-98 / G3) TaxID=412133 RepID=A2DNE1_TRIV3|nr:hypothetical protein TVAGG3_1024680 [Trichomonas vaginalis G3]EAY18129.1 hypothetical protein TVAG_306510 [Trichomonas vaginalis G3]KAI5492406.1 hypothetical protein TVAGG3_1024680 [Trichomonas vaginalis G3]|eukprot:XP_001579115.1 hypothetical protein [Trichomonas vaginalis G3]
MTGSPDFSRAKRVQEFLEANQINYRSNASVDSIEKFNSMDPNELPTLKVLFKGDGTLDGRCQLARYLKEHGFDFNDFFRNPSDIISEDHEVENPEEEARKYSEFLRNRGLYYRPISVEDYSTVVNMFRSMDLDHMKSLNVKIKSEGTLDGRCQMSIYLKNLGFDFNDFADSPGIVDWIARVFGVETISEQNKSFEQPQKQEESIPPVEEINEPIEKDQNQMPKFAFTSKQQPKPFKPVQKLPEMKPHPTKEGIKIKVSEFSTPKKENKWEKKEETKEIEIEIKNEDRPHKITFAFETAVFNKMKITYETPRLHSKAYKILTSEENILPDEDIYDVSSEEEVINAIKDKTKLSEKGREYVKNVKKYYKELRFPEKLERQFNKIIIRLENN